MSHPTIVDVASRTMADKPKKWISKAISHPGRETKRAKANGVSVHEQMEEDSHSSNPSLRAAGNLGLRLSGKSKMYAKSRDKMKD